MPVDSLELAAARAIAESVLQRNEITDESVKAIMVGRGGLMLICRLLVELADERKDEE